ELLTGVVPCDGQSDFEVLAQVVKEDARPPSWLRANLPRDLETICLKCLEKEPQKRYPSAGALAEELGRFLRGEPIQARPASVVERALKWVRRRPARAFVVVLSCVVVALLAGGAAWYELRDRSQQVEFEGERERRQAREDRLSKDLAEREYVRKF